MKTGIRKKTGNGKEAGVALLTAILALMALSGIGAALVYLTNTETQINYNYRNEQVAYFAARAGIEEARDRMLAGTITLPANASQVVYLLNPAGPNDTVAPWSANNPYTDDEICHDGYAFTANYVVASDVRCGDPANYGGGWYATPATSTLQWSNTTAALPFKWVRIGLKLNNSIQAYPVDGNQNNSAQVCWNGQGGGGEVPLTAADCAHMAPAMTPVYLLTALGVSSTGARKMIQVEVGPLPAQPFPYGLFGTSNLCNSVSFTGNGSTDSFSSANGGTYAGTQSNSGGDIGSNGGVSLGGNGTIGGSVGVTTPGNSPVVEGACPGSNYTVSGGNAGLANNPANTLNSISAQNFPIPAAPVPEPTPGPVTIPACGCLTPNTYGDIKVTGGTLSLAPGVYNVNSFSISGKGTVTISPNGQVVINVGLGGNGNSPVVDLSGQSVNNPTFIANDFQINYAGTGAINLTGQTNSYFVVDAPNATIKIAGKGDMFGAVLGNVINDSGNGTFHYDKSVSLGPPSIGVLQQISFRHISY